MIAALAQLVPGGASDRSPLNPAGPAARMLAELGWPVLVGFVAVSAVMWGLLLWVMLRRTGTLLEHESPKAPGGLGWVIWGGFVIPALTFSAIFVAALGTMNGFPMDHHEHHGVDIRIVGHQWWWEVQYVSKDLTRFFTTANEIHIPAGKPVDIELVSPDVIHSFWAPRLHGKVDLIPGMDNFIRVQADRPGTYPGACAEFCGLQHAHMRFLVVAEEEAKYQVWLAKQREPAPEPAEPQAARGRKLFLNGPCVLCHTVRGTPARGSVGPDLTHLAGRSTIAASLPRDLANLHAWIVNAPSLKPGTQMPALAQLRGDELHDLVAWLETLH
jgi:cytochrome c oxidase subunit II